MTSCPFNFRHRSPGNRGLELWQNATHLGWPSSPIQIPGLRLPPTVFATDASPDGGGACSSTARGRAKCRLLCRVTRWHWGLRKAAELIGLLPRGIILIESDPTCVKLAKKHCAFVLTVDDWCSSGGEPSHEHQL